MGTYFLENCLEKNLENPDNFLVPSKDELEKLVIGDNAYLIFKDEKGDRRERMWVEITSIDSDSGSFEGKLGNKPVVLSDILTEGDQIRFGFRHIADYMTADELIEERNKYQQTGKISEGAVSLGDVEKLILRLSECLVSEEDRKAVKDELIEARRELEKNTDNVQMELTIQMSVYKFFMFIAINLVSGPIVGKSQKINNKVIGLHKTLLEAEQMILKISKTHLPVLVDFQEQYAPADMKRISDQDLPEFFASIVSEAAEEVK